MDKSFSQKELDKYLGSLPAPNIDLENPRKTVSVKTVKSTAPKAPAPKATAPVEPAVQVAPPVKPTPAPRSGNH